MNMPPVETPLDIGLVQKWIATMSVGASTIRGMAKKGAIGPIREHLARVPLRELKTLKSESAFMNWLERQTQRLVQKTRVKRVKWGTARKVLNILLRNVFYNRYSYAHYRLDHMEESWLEVPLDSQVARRTKEKAHHVPRWKGVIHLDCHVNDIYQKAAGEIAQNKGMSRVHLDMIFWRNFPSRKGFQKRADP